jgi:TP901 family phage tail tape measure protein
MAKTTAKMVTATFAAVQVGQFFDDALKTYETFEQSMANTAAIADATLLQYEQMEASARSMGRATTKTASESADALGYMMSAGWSVEHAIEGLEPVLRLSEATQMDLAQTSDLVTNSMAALGLTVDGLSTYLDVAAVAGNVAALSAAELMESYIGVGGTMRNLNVPLEESASAIGVLANRGIKGSEAGTALNAIMINLTAGAGQAGEMMDKLGISAFDQAGKFIGLEDTLLKVNEAIEMMGDNEESANAALAAIGGKSHIDALNNLMDGLTNVRESGVTEWDEIQAATMNSNDALLNMAEMVTDTLGSAFLRLDSAADDAKISLADAFSDDLKDAINDLAEFIPFLTENFIDFSTKAGPKISKTFDAIQDGAEDAWKVMSSVGDWVIDNFDAIEVAIVGVGSAIIAYKTVEGIIGLGEAFKSMSLVLTNPWIAVLAGSAAAIVGIATAIKTAEKQAVQSNLAEHFGEIALSMEDISEVADYIVMSDSLLKVHESMSAFDDLGDIAGNIQDSIDVINKANWKVSIGMELTGDDQDSYKAEIQEYIANAQEYVLQEQYALDINLSMFSEGDLERQNIVDKLDRFYQGKYAELQELGTELNKVVTDAFNDGLLEPQEATIIAEIQGKMAEIQESLATSDFDARLKMMELQYSGVDLDSESFMALQEELADQVEKVSAEYDESLQLRISQAQVMLNDDSFDFNQQDYDAAVQEYWDDYLLTMSDLQSKSLDFQLGTITQQYSDEMQAFSDNMDAVINQYASDDYAFQWSEQQGQTLDGMIMDIYNNDISNSAKGAISELMESMQPSLEQVETLQRQYENLGQKLPETLVEAIETSDLLSAMTVLKETIGTSGDMDALIAVANNAILNDDRLSEVEENLREQGYDFSQVFADSIQTSQNSAIAPAIDGMYAFSETYLNEVFSKDFDVSSKVNINFNPAFSGLPKMPSAAQLRGYQYNMPAHADGGIFDRPHVAWFAEEGPEAAIPLDGSQNAISLWERVGQLLGVFNGGLSGGIGEQLYNGLTTYQTDNSITNDTNDSKQFIYSPNIVIEGNASREDLDESLSMSMEQFREMMEQYMAQKSRVSFG